MVLKQKIILIIVLILGVLIQIAPVFRSGLLYPFGYGFWGPNGHDGVWHLSLINQISNPFKISMPSFSGEILKNYHPLFDILIKLISDTTHIPTSIWLFQIFPIISALALLYLSFTLGQKITKSYFGGLTLLSLNCFATSFGWLVSLFRNNNFEGESIFWSMQSPSNQINPPYNLSIILILLLLIILVNHLKNFQIPKKQLIQIFIILTILPITKAYSGLVGFGFFGLFSLYSYSKTKSTYLLRFLFASLISSSLIFYYYNPSSSGLLIYKPFWFINSMIDSSDKFYFPKLSSFRYTLESLSYFDIRLIAVYLFSFAVFIVGNFAMRLFGFITLFKKPSFITLSCSILIILLSLVPTLFIQKGTSWNTIQFLYYALFLSNILLTIYLNSILKHLYGKVIIGIIIITNIIGTLGMLPNYLGTIPPAAIPIKEIDALQFLSKQPPGNILTAPYNEYLKTKFKSTPIPLYAYETTSYVSAYTSHPTFVDDYMNLMNSGFDYNTRLKQSTDFFSQKNIYQDRGFLLNNKIDYIYITGLQVAENKLENPNLYLNKIFDNSETIIYKVLK